MDASYVVSLLHAWLVEHPEYYSSWVGPHTQLRYSVRAGRMLKTRVGGHWRRLACWGRVLPALQCVCKFERLARPRVLPPPPVARRERFDEDGGVIPLRLRVLVWV